MQKTNTKYCSTGKWVNSLNKRDREALQRILAACGNKPNVAYREIKQADPTFTLSLRNFGQHFSPTEVCVCPS